MSKNPFTKNSYEWHGWEMQQPANQGKFGMAWVYNDFFWNKTLNRPNSFPKIEAHLYAILFIISGKTDFVFVQDAPAYPKKNIAPINIDIQAVFP